MIPSQPHRARICLYVSVKNQEFVLTGCSKGSNKSWRVCGVHAVQSHWALFHEKSPAEQSKSPAEQAAPREEPGGTRRAGVGHAARVPAGAGADCASRCVVRRRAISLPPLGRGRKHAARMRGGTRHHPARRLCARLAFVRRRPGHVNPRSPLAPRAASVRSLFPLSAGLLTLFAGCHWQQVPTRSPRPGGSRLRSSCACPMRHRFPGRNSARSNAQIAALQA